MLRQVIEILSTFDIVVPQYGKVAAFGYVFDLSAGLNLLAVGLKIAAPPLESTTGTVDGAEIAPTAFQ